MSEKKVGGKRNPTKGRVCDRCSLKGTGGMEMEECISIRGKNKGRPGGREGVKNV